MPIDDAHRDQRSEMKQHIVQLIRLLHLKKVLEQRQMSGAGDRQKFRHTLDQAQDYRL